MTGTCEFGPSFVDTPKGDLDSSNSIDDADNLLVENSILFPYGTTELFPAMRDSNHQLVYQSAHDYAECSNAGICNRQLGECECFPGFTGTGCQRMKCPGTERECSGHGICQSLKKIANKNSKSEYKLWNKNLVHGCLCDPGFFGHDCSMRSCKHGLDPLYLDDVGTVQIPTYFFAILTTSEQFDLSGAFAPPGSGYFRLMVFDHHGESWLTNPIRARASCAEMVAALEAIPNRAVPVGKTVCYKTSFSEANPLTPSPLETDLRITYDALYKKYFSGTREYTLTASGAAFSEFGYTVSYQNATTVRGDMLVTGDLYMMQFFGNVGDFPQPQINTYLNDGSRPALVSLNGTLIARTWTNGMQGLSTDYFADRCDDILIQIKESDGQFFFWGQSWTVDKLIACIGTADQDDSNNEVYGGKIEWDSGSKYTPHIARLVRNTGDPRDGGWFIAFYYDREVNDFSAGGGTRIPAGGLDGAFRVMHPFRSLEDNEDTLFSLYSTNGTLRMAGNKSEAVFDFASNTIYTTNTTFDLHGLGYDGDVSCEARGFAADDPESDHSDCLDKNDRFFLIDPENTKANPSFLNMYTATSIRRQRDEELGTISSEYSQFNTTLDDNRGNLTARYRKNVITTDLNTNWAQDASGFAHFHVYKFIPAEETSYHYISECSNRGLCNTFEGLCECFHGYTSDDCSVQDTISQ